MYKRVARRALKTEGHLPNDPRELHNSDSGGGKNNEDKKASTFVLTPNVDKEATATGARRRLSPEIMRSPGRHQQLNLVDQQDHFASVLLKRMERYAAEVDDFGKPRAGAEETAPMNNPDSGDTAPVAPSPNLQLMGALMTSPSPRARSARRGSMAAKSPNTNARSHGASAVGSPAEEQVRAMSTTPRLSRGRSRTAGSPRVAGATLLEPAQTSRMAPSALHAQWKQGAKDVLSSNNERTVPSSPTQPSTQKAVEPVTATSSTRPAPPLPMADKLRESCLGALTSIEKTNRWTPSHKAKTEW